MAALSYCITLTQALAFAAQYDNITDEQKNIIIKAKESLLFNGNKHDAKEKRNHYLMLLWAVLTVQKHARASRFVPPFKTHTSRRKKHRAIQGRRPRGS